MDTIAEIKAKIKNGEIKEAKSIALTEAMKIELITSLNESTDTTTDIYFRTVIDLLENEIDNEFCHSLNKEENTKKLEKMHLEEVEIAHQRILQNVQSLQKMFTIIEDNFDK